MNGRNWTLRPLVSKSYQDDEWNSIYDVKNLNLNLVLLALLLSCQWPYAWLNDHSMDIRTSRSWNKSPPPRVKHQKGILGTKEEMLILEQGLSYFQFLFNVHFYSKTVLPIPKYLLYYYQYSEHDLSIALRSDYFEMSNIPFQNICHFWSQHVWIDFIQWHIC